MRVLKTIIALIEPLGLAWLGFTALLAVLVWRRRGRESLLLGIPWLLMTLVLCTPLPAVLLASLERPWIGLDVSKLPVADAVVSLGGAGEPSTRETVGFHFTRATDRLMTAIEIARQGGAGTLVFGGGGYPHDGQWASEAEAAKKWIDSWRVLNTPVVSLGICADTHDEAVKTAALAKERGWKSLILVTSASHMTRAEATFKKAGLAVTCAPCNVTSTIFRENSVDWLHPPHAGGTEMFGMWFHELIGSWVYRWRGWL